MKTATTSGRDTNVVLLAAALHGEAWLALLATRPGVGGASTSDAAQVPGPSLGG